MVNRILFFLGALLFPSLLLAQVEEIGSKLDELSTRLQEASNSLDNLRLFKSEIINELNEIKSAKAQKEDFRSHEISDHLQKITLKLSLKAYAENSSTFVSDLDEIIDELKEYYPESSLFLFKLDLLKKKNARALQCEASGFPAECIFKIVNEQDALDEDRKRLVSVIDLALTSSNISALDYLLYSILRTDYFKDLRQSSCQEPFDSAQKEIISSQLSEAQVSARFELLEKIVGIDSKCKQLLRLSLPEIAENVCAIPNVPSCLSSLKIYGTLEMPEAKKNELLKTLLLAKHSADSKEIVKGLLSRNLFTTLTLKERIKLFFAGILPFSIYVATFIVFSLPLIAVLLFFVGPLFIKSLTALTGFRQVKEDKQKPRLDEYSTLLEVLGLEDEATEKEIKKAYRDLAKKYHPDSSDQDAKDEFDRVQAAYDRLMDLRKSWFGSSRH